MHILEWWYVYMLGDWNAHVDRCLGAHMLWWLHAPMFKFFDIRMLIRIDIHMFNINIDVHTLGY